MLTIDDVAKMNSSNLQKKITELCDQEGTIEQLNFINGSVNKAAVDSAKVIKDMYYEFFRYVDTLGYKELDNSTVDWEYPSDVFTRNNMGRIEKMDNMYVMIDNYKSYRLSKSDKEAVLNNFLNNYNDLKENLNNAKADLLKESQSVKENLRELSDYFSNEIAKGVQFINTKKANEKSTEYKDVKAVFDDIDNLKKDFKELEKHNEYSVAGMKELNEKINRIYQDIREKHIRFKAILCNVERLKNDSFLKVPMLKRVRISEEDKIKIEAKKILSDIYELLSKELSIKENNTHVFIPNDKNSLIKALENIDKTIKRIEKNSFQFRTTLGDNNESNYSKYKDISDKAIEILNKKYTEISNRLFEKYQYVYGDLKTNLQSGDNKINSSVSKGKEKGKQKESNVNNRNEATTYATKDNEPSAPDEAEVFGPSEPSSPSLPPYTERPVQSETDVKGKAAESTKSNMQPVNTTNWAQSYGVNGQPMNTTNWAQSYGVNGQPANTTNWARLYGGNGQPMNTTNWAQSYGVNGQTVNTTNWAQSYGVNGQPANTTNWARLYGGNGQPANTTNGFQPSAPPADQEERGGGSIISATMEQNLLNMINGQHENGMSYENTFDNGKGTQRKKTPAFTQNGLLKQTSTPSLSNKN